ncbi:methylation-associated defense system restriction endonuclease subunit S MAD5 [Formosa sp. A9]|uniref:methylation-associated defense system restriction endonuclease subunit S MAD5 n=1 Tax=Formosa sp. A9 TaxID=3442641 RepID=UPI003EC08219
MEIASVPYKSILNGSNIMKPNYHLNYGKKRIERAVKNKKSFIPLGDAVKDVYTGGIFKRVFVEKEEYGLPYISAQHMMSSNPLEVAKTISKKYTPRQEDMTLRNKQILVSCAGTVGNVRLIGEDLDGVIGSQDIIRVIAKEGDYPFGYVYAYLASPTAYNYIQSFIYGSVVPRIEPNTLSKLPVPCFSEEIRKKIHLLIEASLNERGNGIEMLKKAVAQLESRLPDLNKESIYRLPLSKIGKYRSRFEATLQINSTNEFYAKLEFEGVEIKPISDLSASVFTPNIFKRIKVKKSQKSVPYSGGAELLNFRPKLDTYLSSNTKNLVDYKLRRGYLAIQDSGSIQSMGYVSIIPDYLDGIAATNNLVRVVPNEENNMNEYIYAFLKTQQANAILKNSAYGTGQLHIDTNLIKDLKVPLFKDLIKDVSNSVKGYLNLIEQAYQKEKEAIDLVEKEIESWQK